MMPPRQRTAGSLGRPVLAAVLLPLVATAQLAPSDAARPPPPSVATNLAGPLDLARARQIALAGHPSLAVAEARVRQAHQLVRIADASLLPTIGVRGSWNYRDLPDRLFESNYTGLDSTRAEWQALTTGREPGESLQRYLNHPVSGLGEAWSDGELGPYLREYGRTTPSPVVPEADLRRLLDFLEGRQRISEADAEAVADAVRASYLDATIGDTPTTYRAGAQASWMLFDGFSRMFRRAAARHGEARSAAARQDAERLLLGGVAASYYAAQYAREEVGIARGDADFSERLLQEAVRARTAGLRGADDVLDFRVKRTAAEAELLESQRSYRLALHALSTVLALPGTGLPEGIELASLATERAVEPPPASPEAEIAYALQHRPDLAASRATVAARRAQQGIARSTFYPSVWFVGGYDAFREENWDFQEDDFGWNVSVVASLDLFRGGARIASVKERIAALAAADAEVYKTELEAIQEVRDGLATLASAEAQLALQASTLAQVRQFRDLVEMEYRTGIVPALKLHDAQRKLVAAERRQASAEIARHAAWHALQQATARSLEGTRPPEEEHREQP